MKPDFTLILFILVSGWILISGLYVVLTKNIVRAAFALLSTLFGIAVLYVLLQADFLAAVQVLIYVGGINILIIFGVMLTEHLSNVPFKMVSLNVFLASIVCLALLGTLLFGLLTYEWVGTAAAHGDTTAGIGKLLLGNYLLPFEVTSVLLLAVLLGAVAVGRKDVHER